LIRSIAARSGLRTDHVYSHIVTLGDKPNGTWKQATGQLRFHERAQTHKFAASDDDDMSARHPNKRAPRAAAEDCRKYGLESFAALWFSSDISIWTSQRMAFASVCEQTAKRNNH
jgi:hypothetical protein